MTLTFRTLNGTEFLDTDLFSIAYCVLIQRGVDCVGWPDFIDCAFGFARNDKKNEQFARNDRADKSTRFK